MVPYLGQPCVYHASAGLHYAGQVVKVLSDDHVDVVTHRKDVAGNWAAYYNSNVVWADPSGGSFPFVYAAS